MKTRTEGGLSKTGYEFCELSVINMSLNMF